MDIFVISLKRSQDRRVEFDKNNSKYIGKYTFYDAIEKTNIFEKDGEGINEIIQPHNNYNNIEQQYKNFISEICKVDLLWDTCDKAFNIDEFIVLYKTEIMGDDIFNK